MPAGDTSGTPVENVAELKFGKEFEDIHILSNAQVAVILQVSARSAVNRDEELNEVYQKTQRYVDRFNSMNNAEKVRRVNMPKTSVPLLILSANISFLLRLRIIKSW